MVPRLETFCRFAALAALLAPAPPASAAEDASPAVIFLYPADQAAQARAVSDVVSSQLGDLAVSFREVSVDRLATTSREQLDAAAAIAGAADTVAVFWCDLSSDRDALLHLTDGRGSRLLVRKLEIADARSRAESISIVVLNSVRALLAGGTIGVAVPSPARPAPPAAKPPPPVVHERPDTLAMQVAYAVAARSADTPFNHGLHLGVECRFARFFDAFAAYTLSAPIESDGVLADMRLTSHRLSLGLGGGLRFDRLSIGAAAALELDFAAADVSDVAQGLSIATDTTDVIVAFAPSFKAAFAATERISVFAEIGVSLLVNAKRYTARHDQTREVLVETWPAQPFLRFGFAAWLF
jgi:hypothetical protein